MTSERWQKVKEVFQSAIAHTPAERSAFLLTACLGDDDLRHEIESLLAAYEKDGTFIDSPAYEAVAEKLACEQELKAGQIIGHYEILSTLGRGGMGEVYLARDKKLDRKVALKFLTGDYTTDPDRLGRFEWEARHASALNHPNILTIYELGEVDGHRFIATEFIDGETLRQKIAAGPLQINEALQIAEQIASALADAHGAGIIHRDIKPENIMLRSDGVVKVLDFGLAKLVERPVTRSEDPTRPLMQTRAGVVMGTIGYMSPEQARGLPLDARTDIWSLGVTLYEMVAGQAPFEGPNHSDIIAAILEREPRSLTSLATAAPEPLEWIVTKALTKERDDRYQTAREILNDLRRLKQRLSVAAELERGGAVPRPATDGSVPRLADQSATATASNRLKRKRFVWAAFLVALIAIVASTIFWKRSDWFKSAQGRPVVVLMDSPLPDRVYDPETRKNGGTNADDITDILSDLPIVIEKENTSPLWHREDQVLRESPALIVIHRSCFADSSMGVDPQSPAVQVADKKLESFLGYASLGNPNVKFLVYTRRAGDQGPWQSDLQKRFPQLSGRVFVLSIPGGAEHATFRDPNTAKMVRQQVQSILGLH
jgi:serine/threonine protein kinase